MSKTAVAGVIGALLVIGLAGNACSGEDPIPSSAPPVTVQSVQTFADVTLSDGRQVHDVLFDSTAVQMYANLGTQACVYGKLNSYAVSAFTGRGVADVTPTVSNYPTVSPVPGHQPVSFYFTEGSYFHDDGSMGLAQAYSAATAACTAASVPVVVATSTPAPTTEAAPATEAAPTTTTEPPVTAAPTVDVDRPYVPAPRTRVHTGHSGHPCLPGERDGDHDGYCGEGK